MGKFDGVLLASDFDNTLLYTEDALRTGGPVPPCRSGTGRLWPISWPRGDASPSPRAGPFPPFSATRETFP